MKYENGNGSHTIENGYAMTDSENGRVVAVFYRHHDLEDALKEMNNDIRNSKIIAALDDDTKDDVIRNICGLFNLDIPNFENFGER